MGNVDLMRRSNTIRRTFPGTTENPGTKEMVAEVSSMTSKVEKRSDGLPGSDRVEADLTLTDGIPKPVKKTFVQPMSPGELQDRLKGSAVGVNIPGGPAAIKKQSEASPAPQVSESAPSGQQPQGKPGDINPFRQMVREIKS